eukprot:6227286-Prymnesium_polylepis.1
MCIRDSNTGELSAVCEALLYLQTHAPPGVPAVICADSEYGMNQAQGRWKANKNKALVQRTQAALQAARAQRPVRFEHVKGHSSHAWNDAADALANRGIGGSCA